MQMSHARRRSVLVAAITIAIQVSAAGEVLVLRDGRRIDGVLVGVRGDAIEFEHRGGREDGRVRRYDRDEIRAIQFDDGNRFTERDRFVPRGRSGMRERVINVDARTAWTDTGVDIRPGQDVLFESTGETRWGPNRRDGAAGERDSPVNRGRPMPQRNAAALIGKVGSDGDPFFIGDDRQPIRMRSGGRLFLGINDDYLLDNSGSLRVTVAY
jgi:hypothetical protein